MQRSSCLSIGCALPFLAFLAVLGWAVTLGGYSFDDPEIDEARFWVQDFKHDNPDLARQFGQQCKHEIGRYGWTRDGALALFTCIRAKAEASGSA